jgi:dihydroxyacetone kinase
MNKIDVLAQITTMDIKLAQQLEDVKGRRGVAEDVVRLMVPPLRDQLAIMRSIVEMDE